MTITFESTKPRRARPSVDYLVIWRPRGGSNDETRDRMRVVDTFSSPLTMAQVRRRFEAKDKQGFRDQLGEGYAFIVEQGPGFLV